MVNLRDVWSVTLFTVHTIGEPVRISRGYGDAPVLGGTSLEQRRFGVCGKLEFSGASGRQHSIIRIKVAGKSRPSVMCNI